MSNLWSRLRKAHLAQVLLVYIGASWAVLEVADVFIDKFGLPGWFFQAAILLLLIGLVVLATTAWVQARPVATQATEPQPSPWEVDLVDLRESVSHGRLPHLTWARAILGGVIAFALLIVVAVGYVLIRDRGVTVPGPGEAEAAEAPGIAVLPFRVVGPDSDLWREGMIDLLSTNLEGTAGLRKIDPRAVMSHWRSHVGEGADASDVEAALLVARSLGASYALNGSMVGSESGVRVIAEVYEVGSGGRLGSAQVEGTADSLLILVDRLSIELLRTGLLPAASDVPDIDLSRVVTSSLPALRAYLEGEQLYRRSQYIEAIPHFTRAVELDSSFALAHYRLALAHAVEGSPESSEYAERAARLAERLPERAALLLQANEQYSQGRLSAIQTLSRLTTRYPDDVEGWYLLGEAYFNIGSQGLHPREHYRRALRRTIELSPYYGPAYPYLLRDAFLRSDSAEVAQLLQSYRRIDSLNDYCIGFEVAYSLVWGENRGRADLSTVLDTINPSSLQCTSEATTNFPEFADPLMRTFRLRMESDESAVVRANAAWGLAVLSLRQGRLQATWQALEAFPQVPFAAHAIRLHLASQLATYKDAKSYRENATRLGPESQPWHRFLLGVLAVDEGRWADQRQIVGALEANAEAASAEGDSVAAADHRAFAAALRGYGLSRRGEEARALEEMESALPDLPGFGPAYIRTAIHEFLRMETGRLWLERGDPERAREYFESYHQFSSAHRILSMFYLGQVSEALDEPEAARLHYSRFIRWWEGSDPELRPFFEQARRALANLTDEPQP